MSETVPEPGWCPLCGGGQLASASSEEDTNLVCQDCDIESEFLCSVREVAVGYLPLAGSAFQRGAAMLARAANRER